MKWLEIESQICDTHIECFMLTEVLRLAKEAGYTNVKDHWADKCYDEYTIDEAIEKFKLRYDNSIEKLPF